ncbi:hypothetical protein EYF80_067172 [Liparis tanakae]|uniref:Uncharacterized protein n=1 Tax=Liparis tanakae TaxID=230148 RepID=A0A4Z2E1U0_9TELE|nr:hypothetical protein EYF80_067172 [Liparis tanakae]
MTSSWLLGSFQSDEAGGAEREAGKTRGRKREKGERRVKEWRHGSGGAARQRAFRLEASTAPEETLAYEQRFAVPSLQFGPHIS